MGGAGPSHGAPAGAVLCAPTPRPRPHAMSPHDARPRLHVLLASPRGLCAGVVRAIEIVEKALERHGAPIYVRHEIVHNRSVVERLESLGAVFVDELDEIPGQDRPVVFSAHGVPKSVPREARRRALFHLDATCPLVTKVHREAEKHHAAGRQIVLIGHDGHPEVAGTMGQLPAGAIQLSVFQCRLSKRRRAELETRLRELVKGGEDHVLLIDIGPADKTELAVESIGKTFAGIERRAIVV